ncbi:MAG: hypothetical protein ACFFCY_08615 [Promethearchaeota archaeon]
MKIKIADSIVLCIGIILILSGLRYVFEIGRTSSVPQPMEVGAIISGICLIIGLGLITGYIIIKITNRK